MIPQPTPEDRARDAEYDLDYATKSKVNATSDDYDGRTPPWRYRESFHRDCEDIAIHWIRRAVAAEARVAELEAIDQRMCADQIALTSRNAELERQLIGREGATRIPNDSKEI